MSGINDNRESTSQSLSWCNSKEQSYWSTSSSARSSSEIWYNMTLYDTIYDIIWHDMIWYVIWYDIWYDVMWYMIYDMIWYDAIQYNTIQYNTIQYNTKKYNTIFVICAAQWMYSICCNYQPFNSTYNTSCFFWDPYRTNSCFLWAQCIVIQC